MNRILLILLGICFSITANAECSSKSCSAVNVEMLYVQKDADVLVGTSGTEANLNCGTASNGYVTLLSSSDNFNVMYSTLLASRMANKSVRIRISESSEKCTILYLVSEG